jgi:mono/diheme cytochrome c family protein
VYNLCKQQDDTCLREQRAPIIPFRKEAGVRTVLVSVLLLSACAGALAQTEDNQAIYQSRILPLLTQNCGSCHGGSSPQSDLTVTSYEALLRGGKHGQAIVPGSAQTSLLIQYVKGEKSPQMPLGGSLPPATLAELTSAIDSRPSGASGRLSGLAAESAQASGHPKGRGSGPGEESD